MSPTVVLFKMPRLLEKIVQDLISDQPDIDLVGSVTEETGLVEMLDGGRVQVVIESSGIDTLGEFETGLLFRRPSLRVVQVAPNGRTAAVWQLRPDRTLLSEVSSDGLLEAIRAAAPAASELRESSNG